MNIINNKKNCMFNAIYDARLSENYFYGGSLCCRCCCFVASGKTPFIRSVRFPRICSNNVTQHSHTNFTCERFRRLPRIQLTSLSILGQWDFPWPAKATPGGNSPPFDDLSFIVKRSGYSLDEYFEKKKNEKYKSLKMKM